MPYRVCPASAKRSSNGVQLLAASVDGQEDSSEEETTLTSRHETVANLLRRSHVKVSEGEMVVVDLSSGQPGHYRVPAVHPSAQCAGGDSL